LEFILQKKNKIKKRNNLLKIIKKTVDFYNYCGIIVMLKKGSTKMKKKIMFIMMIAIVGLTLTGCKFNSHNVTTAYLYENSDKYLIGNGEVEKDNITKIKINWVIQNVTIEKTDSNKISFSEEIDESEEDKYRMHYFVDGSTLNIKFVESMALLNHLFETKKLTVQIPETMSDYELELDTTSASVSIRDVSCQSLDVNTVSGMIIMNQISVVDDCDIDTTSGEITITNMTAQKADMNTVSGSIELEEVTLSSSLDADTTSGDIYLTEVSCSSLDSDTVSGSVRIKNFSCKESNIDTTSGSVSIEMKNDAGFKIKYHTTSGKVNSMIETKISGGYYTHGDESSYYDVSTVSGSLTIK
jgi:DUF4097 and DUF4098 domain-containing protein YvlB